ncbi:hypothetical protein DBR06_SOUSAS2910113, partial [Sousa chinensis]
ACAHVCVCAYRPGSHLGVRGARCVLRPRGLSQAYCAVVRPGSSSRPSHPAPQTSPLLRPVKPSEQPQKDGGFWSSGNLSLRQLVMTRERHELQESRCWCRT